MGWFEILVGLGVGDGEMWRELIRLGSPLGTTVVALGKMLI